MSQLTQIECPSCGSSIDVQDVLAHQVEEKLKREFKEKLEKENASFQKKEEELERSKQEFAEKQRQAESLFQQQLQAKLQEMTQTLEVELKQKIAKEEAGRLELLEKELQEQSEKVRELNRTKAEFEKLKREKDELQEAVEAQAEQRLSAALEEERAKNKARFAEEAGKIKLQEEAKVELKLKELEKQLADQKRLTEEMKRKQEQGSMQLQGEVLELAIEEWLQTKFPLDSIVEIKKGARGADCLQVVNTYTAQNCGKIYYESKRTKEFQANWVEKFKGDMREKGADIGLLVTEAMPAGMERMGILDGVWICTYEEFKGLSLVLRESVIKLNEAVSSQENKGDKMHLLYDFLTSTTFKMQVEAIVEGFSGMKNSLETEKRSMQRIWKEREKQIDKVIENTIDMYGSIRGIAGNSVQQIDALELSGGQELLD
ncbi:MAG: DUF2130 domain-containing protein [Bacteroidetes bacterium]|nr:DUF2130 domain-containing protein [Bacteroidota bacterium]